MSGHGGGRRKKHEEHEEHENHERWLVSYADMVTLLMVTFIVLFAISQVDAAKFEALKEGMAARLPDKLDMGVERHAGAAARKEVGRQVQRDVMALGHPGAAAACEQAHVDEAHHRAAVDRPAHVLVRLGRKHAADAAPRAIGPEQQPPGRTREGASREVAPGEPSGALGVGLRARRKTDVLEPLARECLSVFAHAARSAISFLVSAIALAGDRPFGQTFEQFMIVWQR